MHAVRLSRRTWLSLVVSGSVGLLAACGGAATATTATTTATPASTTSATATSASSMASTAASAATLEWCVGANNVPPVKAAAPGPQFAQQAPLMKVWLDAIALSKDQNHLVGAITHPAYQVFSKLQGPIQNNILDGKVNPDAGLQQLQQLMQPVLAKYPGW